MSTILTAAGESLIARLQAEGKPLIIDTMILANVPDQDHTQAIAPGVTVPAEAQIALRYAIPPQYRAYVNPNQVVYSAMLGSDMGDFSFNWQGLWCGEHNTLVAVATFPALEKRRYDEANGKTGNNLTRNFLLTFTGARELTGLTISADVWQLDFTVRLNGIDERERLSNFDVYGQAFFDGQGWLLQKTAEAYAFAPGLGYVGGIRAALAESLPLAAPEAANLPQNVWLDVCLKHTGSDRVAEALPMLTPPAATLTDSAADETGLMHYRALVARIEADGSVTDLRPYVLAGALSTDSLAAVPVSRQIKATPPLKGGGLFATDLTLSISAAGAASATEDGTEGSVVYAKDSDTTSRNKAATPAGVAEQVKEGTSSMLCNRRIILTISQTYKYPTTGWYKRTAIAGGGPGGDCGASASSGNWGTKGGNTSIGTLTALGGSSGGPGGPGGARAAGAGGAAGAVEVDYVYALGGTTVAVVIGAGGIASTVPSSATPNTPSNTSTAGAYWGKGATNTCSQGGGGRFPGGPASGTAGYLDQGYGSLGGNGGSNGTPYGGGGGGGAYFASQQSSPAGRGGANGSDGSTTGGNGGNGAVILEFFDPSVAV